MFREIGSYLSENGLGMALVFLLWIIIFEEKALDRIKMSRLKKIMHIPIVFYFISIIIGIIRIAMS
jgi:hypothetical protein